MTTTQPTVAVSDHALERWVERFPGEDLAACFGRAAPVPTARVMAWGNYAGAGDEFFYDAATRAVFVVSASRGRRKVVTVYPRRNKAGCGRRGRR